MFRRYPWRLFIRYFVTQVFLFNFVVLFIGYILSSQQEFNRELFSQFLIYFFIFSMAISAFSSWRFSLPIWRITRKVLRLASKRMAKILGSEEEDIFEEGDAEYSEMDYALARLSRKIKRRKEQLEREREETQAFMSSVEEGLVSFSLEEKLLYFNSEFAANFLDHSQISSGNIGLTDVFRTPEIYEAFNRVRNTGLNQKVIVRMNSRIDGVGRFYAVSLNPLRKGNSRDIYGVIGIFHDITDIKKAEQIRIEFVGNASHELRTPLTSIKGYLETLKGDFKSGHMEQIPDFLKVISQNVDNLIELVNDLLSLNSMDSGSQLKLETVNALAITDHVIRKLAPLATEKNQVIRVTGEIPPFEADAGKIEQVLLNLVGNAIKYIPEGKAIHIRWEKGDRNDIVLRVIDNGPGIPQEYHSRLFERFYRVDKGRTRDQGGTGLGLAIVKHIMQSHRGSVSVRSTVGEGTEFTCIFPQSTMYQANL
jgi:two-component system phosphate regulon sensor histidine kinase PhoR